VISKFLSALITFLAGFGDALPTMAKNQSRRLDIKEPAKRERAKGRELRLKRKNLKKLRRLERRQRKYENR
jgi:hypothetical protein